MAKKSRPWLRLYNDLIDNPKIYRLTPELRWAWIELLCISCRYNGRLPRISDIAFVLRKTAPEVGAHMIELHRAGLLDKIAEEGGTEVVVPHDWADWQSPSVTESDGRYVYIAGDKWGDPVKIGHSKNPWARVPELQTGSP